MTHPSLNGPLLQDQGKHQEAILAFMMLVTTRPESRKGKALMQHAAQVELPLGATEDRICGTINIEKALQEGLKAYEPGLLVRTMLAPRAVLLAHL